jgi:hypothetical protein
MFVADILSTKISAHYNIDYWSKTGRLCHPHRITLLRVYRVGGGISVASGCYCECDGQHSIEWWMIYTQVNPHIQKIAIHSGQFVHVE